MRAGACSGRPARRGEEVARMRLESQHAGRQAAVPRLGVQQREHRLVAAVHAVEVADRQRTGGSDAGVAPAAEDLHGRQLWRALSAAAPPPSAPAVLCAAAAGRRLRRGCRRGAEHRLGPVEPAPAAGRQVGRQRERAVGAAVQAGHRVAGGGDHALDLVVLAFGQRQPQRVAAGGLAGGGAHRLRVVAQHHAGEQRRHLRGAHRLGGAHLVDLGHMALRRAQAVDQRAVVGEQQQAGGVLVEAADRLHAARRAAAPAAATARPDGASAAPSTRSRQACSAPAGRARGTASARRRPRTRSRRRADRPLPVHRPAARQRRRRRPHPAGADQRVAAAPGAEALAEQQLLPAHGARRHAGG